jgi:hypothetical protein
MPRSKKTWVSILTTAAVVLAGAVILVVAAAAFVVYQHTTTQFIDAATADAQLDRQRDELAGQEPLIEMRGVDAPVMHRRPQSPRREVLVVHVLSYDPRVRKLVKADVPGWLLRVISGHGSIRLANLYMLAYDRDRITLEDLERHGPGLICDFRARSRVLVWTE